MQKLTDTQKKKLESDMQELRNRIATAKAKQQQRDDYAERVRKLKVLRAEIMEEQSHVKESIRFLTKHQNDKRLRDSETIQDAMRVASLLVLPRENLDLRFETRAGLRPESLLVVRKNGKQFALELREGHGVSESVSFLTSLSVLHASPYAKCFLSDEYFASISPENSIRVSSSLNDLADGKFQIIMIEQKDEIVRNTKHRLFLIHNKDGQARVETQDII